MISCTLFGATTSRAHEPTSKDPPGGPARWDTWSGYFATPETSAGFGGATFAFNGDKTKDGWRARIQGGTTTYNYTSTRTDGLNVFDVEFAGQGTSGDALGGYQMQIGEFTGKLFAGVSYSNHIVGPRDPDNPVVGEKWGAKVVAEGWYNVGEASFISFDVAYATPFATYSGQIRYGQSIWDRLWIGVEAGAYGNAELNAGKIGGFGRWQTSYGTLWLAGGVSGDYDDPTTPYGSLTYVKSF